jgi:aromatic ring-opening dioxygenase catalytic subunit (LigB family)
MMGEIVYAAGLPHAPALVGLFERAPPRVQQVVRASYDGLTQELDAARPDVLVVFANDHLTNSRIRAYPDFLIGMAAEHRGPHEWFKPWIGCRDYVAKGEPAVAGALFRGMTRRGIRMHAERGALNFDDNISVPTVLMDLDRRGVPIVPVLQNCTVPPYPDQHRCYAVGRALADFIRHDLPSGLRVGLIGSGGLSHEPGGARYYFIDEDFDRWFLDLCCSGDHRRLLDELTVARMEGAGSGGTSELLAWVVVMGAIGARCGHSFGYAIHSDFRCGIGAVAWELEGAADLASPSGADLPRAPAPFVAARQDVDGRAAPGHDDEKKQTMSFFERFDPSLAGHDLVQDLKWDPVLRRAFERDEKAILDRYALRPQERRAIEERDFRALYDLGFHPYLGGQLARLIYGNDAGGGAIRAVNKLVESLQRRP